MTFIALIKGLLYQVPDAVNVTTLDEIGLILIVVADVATPTETAILGSVAVIAPAVPEI